MSEQSRKPQDAQEEQKRSYELSDEERRERTDAQGQTEEDKRAEEEQKKREQEIRKRQQEGKK